MENVKIRTLRKDDLDAIVEVERKVLGQVRKDYWDKKLETIDPRASQASFIAEREGVVVGFILADVSGWEFGVPDTTGWIDTIGVDPELPEEGARHGPHPGGDQTSQVSRRKDNLYARELGRLGSSSVLSGDGIFPRGHDQFRAEDLIPSTLIGRPDPSLRDRSRQDLRKSILECSNVRLLSPYK